jgi:1,4-dihydroxy-2-naphthoate octaprenyltransferase
MSSEWITLGSKDPRFQSYLMGRFSKDKRALPVKTLNASSELEVVTFQIVDVPRVQFLQKWSKVLKIHHWVLPISLVLMILISADMAQQAWDPIQAAVGSLALLCWMAAMTLRNDYLDHVSGLDRIFEDGIDRPLQKGWVTAEQIQKLALIFLGAGSVLGSFCLIRAPVVLIPVGATVFLAMWALGLKRVGLQYRLWTEVFAFLLLGPFLSLGFSSAVGLSWSLSILGLGLLNGIMVVLLLHLKNFERMMVQSQLGQANSMTILGFDKGKIFLQVWFSGYLLALIAYHFLFLSSAWSLGFSVLGVALSLLFARVIARLKSPLSSNFHLDILNLNKIVYVVLATWILEYLGYMLVVELV